MPVTRPLRTCLALPQGDIARLKARMGWERPWYTITDSFDADFGVDDYHGTNAFLRVGEQIFRTYFLNHRGDEALGSVWSYLDLSALGRQEEWEDSPEGYPQVPAYSWWRRHDEYDSGTDPWGGRLEEKVAALHEHAPRVRRGCHVNVVAHVGGVPVEEVVAQAVGATAVTLLVARAWLSVRLRRSRGLRFGRRPRRVFSDGDGAGVEADVNASSC